MSRVYLALGSNLSDRLANLRTAIQSMPPEVIPLDCSSVYETPPWGYLDQPVFLNQVIRAETDLDPEALLRRLKNLEQKMGRQPTIHYGPRLIDLDILLYDDLVLDYPGLTIPHPRLAERTFVLVPLAELAPDLIHPLLGVSMAQLLAVLDTSGVKQYKNNQDSISQVKSTD